jgi:putative CocE/NonD family hydrolase
MTNARTSLILLVAGIVAAAMPGVSAGLEPQDVLIKTRDGATLSAVVAVPPMPAGQKLPALLVFTIYTDPVKQRAEVEEFAGRGYAGVVANVRGKGQSPDAIVPYEHDASDTHAVLDWIVKQSWSDGRVGMLGGSYSGFTAWAATKRRHPALRAIATIAAAIPGQGLPMYNNVFLSANYAWAFHVTNNKTVDESVYADSQRWSKMTRSWFASGRPYRELDAVDGTPNPWLQRWLKHPDYDEYWQRMVPQGREFARVDIPVLTITGYYDDAQISALHYFKEHVAHRRQGEHYLLMGPYDHLTSQARRKPEVLRDYTLDPVAQLDSRELMLAFMDHALLGKPRPERLADRVNVQVMGANEWRHAPNLDALHGIPMRLYFSEQKQDGLYSLPNRAPPATSKVVHEVDLADRVKFHNFHAYPAQIVQGPLQFVTESIFVSDRFEAAATVMGSFSGELMFVTNKKDFDLGITVLESMPDGKLFHLAHALHRASHADSPGKRRLLSPGKPSKLRFETTLVSRRMQPGSRLMVLVDANKHPMAQVNYGTGKDVSDESIADAREPLRIEISSGSFFEIPLDNAIPRPD